MSWSASSASASTPTSCRDGDDGTTPLHIEESAGVQRRAQAPPSSSEPIDPRTRRRSVDDRRHDDRSHGSDTPRSSTPDAVNELHAITDAGAKMVAAAERFADEFTAGAFEHDRTATFAAEHLDKLRADRYLVSPVPSELGGGGVASIHDVVVASARLARGDPSTTIGVNMHFAVVLNLIRSWNIARARAADERAHQIANLLQRIADDDVVFASAVSEPAPQDLTRPRTTAIRTSQGWSVSGCKVFATMAPAATVISVAVAFTDDDGQERYGFAWVPPSTPGVELHDDWDAIGMRASASGSLSLHDVRLGADAVRDGFPAGTLSVAWFERFLASGLFHASASLGIAESAQTRIEDTLNRRRESVVEDPHAMIGLAENIVDLAAMQASLSLAARRVDEYFAASPRGEAGLEDAQAITADVQAAKTAICDRGQRVTDRALALSGGAGYMTAHPLAKAWRDARAGAFMHPFGVNRALELLARTSLGIAPRGR